MAKRTKELNSKIYGFIDDAGFTPLCDSCEYTDLCVIEGVDDCPVFKDIVKKFKKHFKTINE